MGVYAPFGGFFILIGVFLKQLRYNFVNLRGEGCPVSIAQYNFVGTGICGGI
jgi:hypothetical protein